MRWFRSLQSETWSSVMAGSIPPTLGAMATDAAAIRLSLTTIKTNQNIQDSFQISIALQTKGSISIFYFLQ